VLKRITLRYDSAPALSKSGAGSFVSVKPGSGAEAAVDGQAGTGDIARLRAGEVGDEAGDFVRGAVATYCEQRD